MANGGDLLAKNLNVSKAINTDWLDADLGPYNFSRTVRLSLWMDAGGIVNLQVANHGTTVVENLNEAVALTADSRYAFDIELAPGDAVNVQHTTGGTQAVSIRAFDVPKA